MLSYRNDNYELNEHSSDGEWLFLYVTVNQLNTYAIKAGFRLTSGSYGFRVEVVHTNNMWF